MVAQRSSSLDFLRGVAVLLVIGRHLPLLPSDSNPVLRDAVAVWHRGGWVGVDLFFVLSGFLISGLLFREYEKHDRISLPRFFVRRGLKIYPSFYVFLAATIVVRWCCGEPLRRRAVAAELVFLQNYAGDALWGHTWSLAVEEHFYLLLPIALIVMARFRGAGGPFRNLPAWVAGVSAAVLALRVLCAWLTPEAMSRTKFETHFRIDSLLFGVLLSYWYWSRREQMSAACRLYRTALMVAGAALSIPAFLLETDGSFYHHTFGFTCSYLAAGMILVASLYSPILGTALFRPVVFVGARSYSIYLWHVPTGVWLFPLLRQYTADAVPTALWYALYVGGPVLIGTAFAWVIEYPVLKLRDRFFPSRSNPLLAEPASGATPSPVGMAPRADAVLGDAGAPCRPCAVSEPSN